MVKQMRLCIICSVILILANKAQSFVLLTANMKDIKKIASNFVSDALADKIAEFVMKATETISDPSEGGIKTNNNINGDISIESRENDKYIGRQRENNQRDDYISERYKKGNLNTDRYKKDNRNTDRYKKDSYNTDNKDNNNRGSFNFKKERDFNNDFNKKAEFDAREEKQKSKYWSKEKDTSLEKPDGFDHEQLKWHKEVIEISNERDNIGNSYKFDRDRHVNQKSNENTRRPTTEKEYWKKRDNTKNKISSERDSWKKNDDRNKISSDERPEFKFDDNNSNNHQNKPRQSEKSIFQYYNKPTTKKPISLHKPEIKESDMNNNHNRPRNEESYSNKESRFAKYESKGNKNPSKNFDDSPDELELRYKKKDRFKSVFDSEELRYTKYNDRDTTRYRSGLDLTTKKEKTDFDQYDNRNYPKAEFVATSGNLMLPRVHEMKKEANDDDNNFNGKAWWEKEMPNLAKIKI